MIVEQSHSFTQKVSSLETRLNDYLHDCLHLIIWKREHSSIFLFPPENEALVVFSLCPYLCERESIKIESAVSKVAFIFDLALNFVAEKKLMCLISAVSTSTETVSLELKWMDEDESFILFNKKLLTSPNWRKEFRYFP